MKSWGIYSFSPWVSTWSVFILRFINDAYVSCSFFSYCWKVISCRYATVCLSIHLFVGICVVSSFELLQIKLLLTLWCKKEKKTKIFSLRCTSSLWKLCLLASQLGSGRNGTGFGALKNTMLFKPHFITFHSMYLFNKLYRWTHNYIKQVSCLGTFFSLSTHLLSIHFIFRCEEKVNCCYARHQDNYSSWRNEKKAFSFHMIHLFFNNTLATPGVSFLFYASVVFWIDCQALECRGRRLSVPHSRDTWVFICSQF